VGKMLRVVGGMRRGSGISGGSRRDSRHFVDSFLLNISLVKKLGSIVVNFLHERFQEAVFISSDTRRIVEFGEDIVYCFKE
jgi:hypothetical protein